MRAAPAPLPPVERRLTGIALRCASATAFAAMGGLLKLASVRGVSVPELVFYRSLGAFPLVAGWVLLRAGSAGIATRQPLAHLTRSCIGLASMLLTFAGLALLPLGEATTLSYSAPITATLLSALLLGERVGRGGWLAVLTGFAGVLLVARPAGAHLPALGLAAALGASIGQAAVMITIRQISRTEPVSAIVFWFTTFTLLVSAASLPLVGHWHGARLTAMLAGAGLLGGVGQLTMTGSLRFASVSVVAPFDYVQVILATLIGWLVFAAPLAPSTLTGALLIAAAGLYTLFRQRRSARVEAELAPEL